MERRSRGCLGAGWHREFAAEWVPSLGRGPGGERVDEPLGAQDLEALCSHLTCAFEGAGPAAAAIAGEPQGGDLGPKWTRLAALLRRSLFLQRYSNDMAARPSRVEKLARQW